MSAKTETFEHRGWRFVLKKGNMLPSQMMSEWGGSLKGSVNLPDVVYGDNVLCCEDIHTGVTVSFTALDALRGCMLGESQPHCATTKEYARCIPRVAHADKWQERAKLAKRYNDVRQIEATYDWTFSTPYWGSVTVEGAEWKDDKCLTETSEELPLELLTRKDPIMWYNQLELFEDDLSDNGVVRLNIRVRVMPTFWFVLMRQVVRVDGVIVRQVDTRLFHSFESRHVLREFMWSDATFDELRQRGVDVSPGSPHISEANVGNQLLGPADTRWRVMQRIALPDLPADVAAALSAAASSATTAGPSIPKPLPSPTSYMPSTAFPKAAVFPGRPAQAGSPADCMLTKASLTSSTTAH